MRTARVARSVYRIHAPGSAPISEPLYTSFYLYRGIKRKNSDKAICHPTLSLCSVKCSASGSVHPISRDGLLPPAYSRDSPDAAEIDTDAGLRRGGAGGATAPRPRTAYTPALYVAARGASTYGAARSRSRGTFAGIVASPSEITCSSRAQEQLNNNNPVRPQSSRTRSDPGPVL